MHLQPGVHLNRHPFTAAAPFALAVASVLLTGCTSTTTSATAPSTSKCQVSASATPLQFAPGGGTGQLTVTAARDCAWSITLPVDWVAVSGERAGSGSVTLPFTVASNPAPAARSADLVIEEVRVGVTQAAAPCTYSLKRASDAIDAAGGTIAVELTTLNGCNWTASSAASWLSLSRASGQSSGNIPVTVAANTGAARTGVVTVGGQAYTVTQMAGMVTTPPPTDPPPPTPPPTPPPPTPPPPTDPPGPITVSGAVSGLIGSCPSLRFRVDGRDVTTDGSTEFKRGKCRDVSNGDTVKVSGVVQSSGLVLASTVELSR